MLLTEMQDLTFVESEPEMISVVDVVTECFDNKVHADKAITLCLGYTHSGDIVHVYMQNEAIHRLVVRESYGEICDMIYNNKAYIVRDYARRFSFSPKEMTPDVINPNKTLGTFAKILDNREMSLLFAPFDEEAPSFTEKDLAISFSIN